MKRHARPIPAAHRIGSVLVLTVTVLIALTSLALILAGSMRTEAAAASNYVAKVQARAVADGAVEYVRSILTGTPGTPIDDSTLNAQAASVAGGYFWLLKHDSDTPSGTWKFGINDEAGKLNVNFATADEMSLLPNSTTTIGACIVDWHTPGETASPNGAKSPYYLSLPTPYRAKGSSIETVDELLMVKDITPQILWGQDTNRNGRLDAGESASTGLTLGESNGGVDLGFAPFVTVYSLEPNTSSTGQSLTNVNTASTRDLSRLLGSILTGEALNTVVNNTRSGRPFHNIIDYYYRSGLSEDDFKKIAGRLSTSSNTLLRGLVNLNTAPRAVLQCLPGLTQSDADTLVAHRTGTTTGYTSVIDLIDILPREKSVPIAHRLTVRSYQYSADIVAVDPTGRAFVRLWVVFDARTGTPKVVYRADWSSLGWPLDPSILTELRAGRPPAGAWTGLLDTTGTNG